VRKDVTKKAGLNTSLIFIQLLSCTSFPHVAKSLKTNLLKVYNIKDGHHEVTEIYGF